MAELALVLSIVSLIKLSNTVLTSCAEYVGKVKNAPGDINKIINEVSGLEFILKRLSNLVPPADGDPSNDNLSSGVNDSKLSLSHSDALSGGNNRSKWESDSRLASLRALHSLPAGPFRGCSDALEEISKKLSNVSTESRSAVVRRRLLWPFEKDKLEKLLSGLEKHKTTFLLALAGDLHEKGDVQSAAIAQIGSHIEDLKLLEERKAISEWLRGADPSTNHNAARKKHTAGTGDWLPGSNAFETWKKSDGAILWLNGISGSGKTILSSSVVEDFRQNQLQMNLLQQTARVVYFYFDFSDQAKQNAHGCIQSIVKQLFEQSVGIPEEIESLYRESKDDRPPVDRLVEALISMLSNGPSTSIVIDALDECKAEEGEEEQEIIYETLKEIKSKTEGGYRIFIASRPEPDIKRELVNLGVIEVDIETTLVDEDIRAHLRVVLPKEQHFKKWPAAVKKQMEDTLVTKSNGM